MPRINQYLYIRVLFGALVFSNQAHAEYIAQIEVQQSGAIDSVYIKLLERDAPLTVRNFRNYVADGDYTSSFFHRSVPGFIIQGGGFSYNPQLNTGDFVYDSLNDLYPGGLQLIPQNPAITNEFKNSNLKGTLAMALQGGNQNSATSQWFINQVDNAFLDTSGFTVFAEILGNGMNVVDTIANQPVIDRSDIHPVFGSIPLVNYSAGDPVTSDNLVRINSITEVLSISPDISYGSATPGSNLQPEIVIQNIGNNPITIGVIAGQDSLAQPFSIVTDLCSNRTLFPGQKCSFIVLFWPKQSGSFNDSFDVEFPGLGLNYTIKLSGVGGSIATEPDFSSGFSSIDFGETTVLASPNDTAYRISSTITNFGGIDLNISTIALSQNGDSAFTLRDAPFQNVKNCVAGNVTASILAPNESCKLQVLYQPLVEGKHTAKLIFTSDDPDEGVFEIPVSAVASLDYDGIDKVIEDAAPNNGDANNDGVLDKRQSNVASLLDLRGIYNTYLSTSSLNQSFRGVRTVSQNLNDANPDNITLDAGVHEFTLVNVAPGAIVQVGLLLPANVTPSAYYIYGSTPERTAPHWYNFDFDGETGASFIGAAKITSPTGQNIQMNIVSLRIKNGGRGDSSVAPNNFIIVQSGVEYSNTGSGNGGSGFLSPLLLQTIVLILALLRAGSIYLKNVRVTNSRRVKFYGF